MTSAQQRPIKGEQNHCSQLESLPAVLDAMDLPALETHFLAQQRRYDLKFKRR
jgi:hypothetical protein